MEKKNWVGKDLRDSVFSETRVRNRPKKIFAREGFLI